MECFNPEDSWVRLHEYLLDEPIGDIDGEYRPLAKLLGALRKNEVVYGKLRPNNIMYRELEFEKDEEVEEGEELEMKVTDFDRVGRAGLARYLQVQKQQYSMAW